MQHHQTVRNDEAASDQQRHQQRGIVAQQMTRARSARRHTARSRPPAPPGCRCRTESGSDIRRTDRKRRCNVQSRPADILRRDVAKIVNHTLRIEDDVRRRQGERRPGTSSQPISTCVQQQTPPIKQDQADEKHNNRNSSGVVTTARRQSGSDPADRRTATSAVDTDWRAPPTTRPL